MPQTTRFTVLRVIVASFFLLVLHATLGVAQCDPSPPSIKDDYTVTASLYAGNDCCSSPVRTISLGVLDSCHSTVNYSSLKMAVGQQMFDRNIVIFGYTDEDCQQPSGSGYWSLTNTNICSEQTFNAPYNSIKISYYDPCEHETEQSSGSTMTNSWSRIDGVQYKNHQCLLFCRKTVTKAGPDSP
jgi:hypothetical protein